MQPGADESAAYSGAGLWGLAPVVDDEVQQFTEIIVSGPAVQLFPLVCAHEPV